MTKCKFKSGAWECPLEAFPREEYCYWHKEEDEKGPDDAKLREVPSFPHIGISGGCSHFIHLSLPGSLTGIGSDVKGFSSGRPDPRPAERATDNTVILYKYFPHSLLLHLKGYKLAATIFLKFSVICTKNFINILSYS